MKLNTDGKLKTLAIFLYRNKDTITKIVKEDAPRILQTVKSFIWKNKQ